VNPLLSSGLLAASLFMGQTPEPPPFPPLGAGKIAITQDVPTPLQQTQGKTVQPSPMPDRPSRPLFGWFQREDRPLMNKLQGWFKREPQDSTGQGTYIQPSRNGTFRETAPPPIGTPVPPPTPSNDFPRKLPMSSQSNTPPITIVADTPTPLDSEGVQQAKIQEPATAKTTPAKTPIRSQFANKIGRDEKFEWITGQFELENNSYVLHYATPETVDKHNGRVVLVQSQENLKEFRRGDLISVRGQLSQRTTQQGVLTIYRVEQAHLIERPKQ
jgi:hypothetical protein